MVCATRPKDTRTSHACADRSQVETSWTRLKTISKTELPQGRLSMLVDLGSRISVVGFNTER
eukprot:1395343-Lingulodinium_polyedra.AAC.1